MTVAVSGAHMRTVLDIMRQAAAERIMPSFRHLGVDAIRCKSSKMDVVTVADEAAEHDMTAAFLRLSPGAVVIGEEAVCVRPDLMDAIEDADLAYVIDPIDGTANYAAGVPLFGVMVAILRRGEVIGAAILDPVCNIAALAVRGGGGLAGGTGRCRATATLRATRAGGRDVRQCLLALSAASGA
ncbi:hypothetical protein GLI01_34670 [Gluconacetobacter liquefaciens]|nr:inositol monophosphatase [Gluconacetobacter liquefaciens NRIC 0522]GEB39432.1 hypothetical protein GLI01_34670 [Gluconacetobacter liquefaciens]